MWSSKSISINSPDSLVFLGCFQRHFRIYNITTIQVYHIYELHRISRCYICCLHFCGYNVPNLQFQISKYTENMHWFYSEWFTYSCTDVPCNSPWQTSTESGLYRILYVGCRHGRQRTISKWHELLQFFKVNSFRSQHSFHSAHPQVMISLNWLWSISVDSKRKKINQPIKFHFPCSFLYANGTDLYKILMGRQDLLRRSVISHVFANQPEGLVNRKHPLSITFILDPND